MLLNRGCLSAPGSRGQRRTHWGAGQGLAFITASGVSETACVTCEVGGRLGDTRPFFPGFFCLPCVAGRDRVFLKICTMSRLMGNMRRELSKPIITSCHVNSILPVKIKQRGGVKITPGTLRSLSCEKAHLFNCPPSRFCCVSISLPKQR